MSKAEEYGRVAPSASERRASRLRPGDPAPVRRFRTIASRDVALDGLALPTHLQFRRFAGCPVCSVHLLSFARRRAEWEGVFHEVVLFHSPESILARHAAGLPLDVVADPGRRIYRAYGVEASPRALLDPRGWSAIMRSVGATTLRVLRNKQPMPPIVPEDGSLGLPADFLIGPDGAILDRHYGVHAADQWSVDEVVRRARRISGE